MTDGKASEAEQGKDKAGEAEEVEQPMLSDDEKKKNDVTIPDDGIPYDKGWAWMVVLAGFINFVIMAGYNRGIAIFFVNYLEEFRAPVTETALLYGVKSAVNSIVGLFIMNAVVGRFGVRKTVMLGGIFLSLSAILGSFATDLTSLILSQAVFHGLGMSMLGMPTTVLLGFYFRRRRSLANSLTKCGVGVGAVAFPPLVTFLLDRYGLRGSLLLMGGVCLHAVVAASLLRPVSFYRKPTPPSPGAPSEDDLALADGAAANCDDGKLDGAKHRGTDDLAAKMVAVMVRSRGTVVPEGSPTNAPRNGGRTDPENAVVEDERMRRTIPEDCAADTPSTPGTDPGRCCVTIEASGKCTVLEVGETNTADRTVALDKVDGGYDEGGGTVHNGRPPQSGTARDNRVLPIEKDGCLVSVRGLSDAKQQLLCPVVNGITALSKSTPELYCKKPCRPRRFSDKDESQEPSFLDSLCQSPVTRYLSKPDIGHDTPATFQLLDQRPFAGENTPVANRTCLQATWTVVKRAAGVLDFRLFYSPMFRMMVVFFIFSPMSQAGPSYLPAMAKERNLDENQRATLLSVIGGLDFFGRLACGFLVDTHWIKASTMICVAFAVLGVLNQLTRLLLTFDTLMILAVGQGMFGGVAACVMPILVMEDIGLENTAKAFGFQKLFSGASMAVFHPLLGFIRDATGSYELVYNVIGAGILLSAAAIACLSCLPHKLPDRHLETTMVTHTVEPQR